MDGMSITMGTPRSHIFTLALGTSYDTALGTAGMCPCGSGTQSLQRLGQLKSGCRRVPMMRQAFDFLGVHNTIPTAFPSLGTFPYWHLLHD